MNLSAWRVVSWVNSESRVDAESLVPRVAGIIDTLANLWISRLIVPRSPEQPFFIYIAGKFVAIPTFPKPQRHEQQQCASVDASAQLAVLT